MARNWYYVDESDEEVGPVDSHVIRARVADGTISKQTLVWRDDLPDWVEAGRIRKLFEKSNLQPASSFRPATSREPSASREDSPAPKQAERVARPAVDLHGAEDDWASLAEEPIAYDDPFAYHDDSGQALRSFARPAPKPVQRDNEDEDNPYAVTGSIRQDRMDAASGSYAHPIARLAARIIDGLTLIPIFGAGYGAIAFAIMGGGNNPDAGFLIVVAVFLGIMLISILHALVFIPWQNASVHQASWGKRAVGIIVTNLDGERATFGQTIGREAVQMAFGFVPCLNLIDVVWLFFDDQKQCLHDKTAGTLVLRRD